LRSTPAVAPRYTDTPHVAKLNGNTTLPEHLTRLILAYASAIHNTCPLSTPLVLPVPDHKEALPFSHCLGTAAANKALL
jgi:hypothetical protein